MHTNEHISDKCPFIKSIFTVYSLLYNQIYPREFFFLSLSLSLFSCLLLVHLLWSNTSFLSRPSAIFSIIPVFYPPLSLARNQFKYSGTYRVWIRQILHSIAIIDRLFDSSRSRLLVEQKSLSGTNFIW